MSRRGGRRGTGRRAVRRSPSRFRPPPSRAGAVGDVACARRRRGAAIVLAATLVLGAGVLAGKAVDGSGETSVLSEAVARLVGDGEVDASSLSSALSVLDAFEVDAEASLATFQDEALTLVGREELLCEPESGLVGFVVAGDAGDAFEGIRDELEGKGWSMVDSGLDACATFVKDEGVYDWLFVSCVQVGDSACVVVQVEAFEEGA